VAEMLICKTNINTKRKLKLVEECLSANQCIKQWNVDMKDCDYVLRIQCQDVLFEEISKLLAVHGIVIAELSD